MKRSIDKKSIIYNILGIVFIFILWLILSNVYNNSLVLPKIKEVFEALGLTEEQIQVKFGFMLDAFKYGTPPHAGIALGLDRLIAMMARTESIRDVIAFPKNSQAKDLMADAPSMADELQLRDLRIQVKPQVHTH